MSASKVQLPLLCGVVSASSAEALARLDELTGPCSASNRTLFTSIYSIVGRATNH